jgi:hypothetical protein
VCVAFDEEARPVHIDDPDQHILPGRLAAENDVGGT